jgi:hypothetical protein
MEWKCVKQNQPTENTDYIVFDGDIFTAEFQNGMWFKNGSILVQDVTHFMNLPNRPERLSEKTPKGDAIV